jgi:hypothetical protein
MEMRTIDLLSKIYDRDPETGNFIIKLSINEYTDIFNELDPSPLRRRDVAQPVVDFLDDCSADIPLKYKFELQILCPREIMNEGREHRTMNGLRTFFSYMVLIYKKDLRVLSQKALMYFVTSIVLIVGSLYTSARFPSDLFFKTLVEGLSIGGWVFLWEAIVLSFFKSRKIRIKRARYRRLLAAPVSFIYQTIN